MASVIPAGQVAPATCTSPPMGTIWRCERRPFGYLLASKAAREVEKYPRPLRRGCGPPGSPIVALFLILKSPHEGRAI